jgi:hypothetical protein
MRKRTRRLVFFYFPLLVLIVTFGIWTGVGRHVGRPSRGPGLNLVNVQPEELTSQSSVENQLKIDVGVDKLTDTEVVFHVVMESYQNGDAIQADPLETTILTIQGETPFKPIHWKETRRDDFHKEGYLTFEINKKPTVLKLSIFELVERTFEWSLVSTASAQ